MYEMFRSQTLLSVLCVAQLLPRLQDRQALVQKECNKLPAAPKGKDIFQLCRGFERAFSHTVEVSSHIFCKLTDELGLLLL